MPYRKSEARDIHYEVNGIQLDVFAQTSRHDHKNSEARNAGINQKAGGKNA